MGPARMSGLGELSIDSLMGIICLGAQDLTTAAGWAEQVFSSIGLVDASGEIQYLVKTVAALNLESDISSGPGIHVDFISAYGKRVLSQVKVDACVKSIYSQKTS